MVEQIPGPLLELPDRPTCVADPTVFSHCAPRPAVGDRNDGRLDVKGHRAALRWGCQPELTECKPQLTWGAAALLLGIGCAPEPDAGGGPAAAGPSIVPVDSVLLVETGGLYVGNPFSLVPDTTDGSLLISDFFENRILRFDRDGRLLRTYGRPGEGPGEFLDIGPAFILNDSIVVGADDERKLLQLFSATDGAYLRAFEYRGRLGMGTWSVLDGGVVFPSRELAQGTSVAIWRYPREEVDYVVPLPDEYRRSANHPSGYVGRFAAFFSMGTAVAWRDTLLSGMSGLNEIFLSTWGGEAVDTLALPSVRRRGVPPDAQERLDDFGFRGSPHEVLSTLSGLHRLSDGATAVFHHDATLEGEQPRGTITADIHLSVIAPDRKTACVDGPVPHFGKMRPIHTVTRDTVFLLDRRVNEAEDGLETWVRMYRIDTTGCDWVGVG